MRRASRAVLAVAFLCVAFRASPLGARQRAGGPAQGGPDMPTGGAFLFGQVVEAGGGSPIAGAVVTLMGSPTSAGLPPSSSSVSGVLVADVSGWAPKTAITNRDGYFFFRDLGPGRYALAATAIGYVPEGAMPNRPRAPAVHVIDLTENEKRSDLLIRLTKYASISGTVLDDRGEPATGATVTVFQRGIALDRLAVWYAASVAVDDRGVYRAGGLLPGNYVVGIVSTTSTIPAILASTIDANAGNGAAAFALRRELTPGDVNTSNGSGVRVGDLVLQAPNDQFGGAPMAPDETGRMLSYVTTFYPAAAQWPQATVVALGSGGERTGIDFTMKLAPAVRVSGVISGPTGPISTIQLRLVPSLDGELADGGLVSPSLRASLGGSMAVSDDHGTFAFLGVAPGAYTLKASYVPPPGPPGQPARVDHPMVWASQPVTVGDADITGLAVAVRAGLRATGRMEFVGTSAKPDPSHVPILLRPVGVTFWRGTRALPAADGTFATGGEPPGRYFVSMNDPAGWHLARVDYGGRNVADEPIDLDASDLTDLVVTFTDKTTRLGGSIVDSTGAPDSRASIIVFPADSATWRQGIFSLRRVRLVEATPAGTYEFAGIPAGDYFLVAIESRLATDWEDPAFLDRLTSGATRVTLAAGDTKTVALKRFTLRSGQ